MQEKRLVDHFALLGVGNTGPVQFDKLFGEIGSSIQQPIVDLIIIDRTHSEDPPADYETIWETPTHFSNHLNYSEFKIHKLWLCIRRGHDKPPITNIEILSGEKEKVNDNVHVIETTPGGYSANIASSLLSKNRTFITYQRATTTILCNTLVVTDICVINESKGETPPHAFYKINKSLDDRMFGASIYLCYKKSLIYPSRIEYRPQILYKFPSTDHDSSNTFPDTMPFFCFPTGAHIERWPSKATPQNLIPTFSTFFLSTMEQYGVCLSFYELFTSIDRLPLTNNEFINHLDADNDHLYASMCVVILSHYPFLDTFRRFLLLIHKLIIASDTTTTSDHSRWINKIPLIEQYLKHFFNNVPFPSPSNPRICVQYDFPLLIVLPDDNGLPQNGASFIQLIRKLGTDNTLTLFLHALFESKLLIHSLRPSILTCIVEAVTSMIFPLQWKCTNIPFCPLVMHGVVDSPSPFIIGIDSRYFDVCQPPPSDVICVDLDANIIMGGTEEQKQMSVKMFPKKPFKLLRQSLKEIEFEVFNSYQQDMLEFRARLKRNRNDFESHLHMIHLERQMETRIREIFLRFMCTCFYDYEKFLQPISRRPNQSSTDVSVLFQFDNFLSSRDSSYEKFYSHILPTQMFSYFIQKRSLPFSNTLSQETCVNQHFHCYFSFFDHCCAKVKASIDNNEHPAYPLLEIHDKITNFHSKKPTLLLTFPSDSQAPRTAIESIHNNLIVKRSKLEREKCQKVNREQKTESDKWAYCLLSNVYSLWFMLLPIMIEHYKNPRDILDYAYKVLIQIHQRQLTNPDEICFRVIFQLCSLYDDPILAVKTYSFMKKTGVECNAITYGTYNKAVYEGTWTGRDYWRTLRLVIRVVWAFKTAHRYRHTFNVDDEDDDDSDGAMSIDSDDTENPILSLFTTFTDKIKNKRKLFLEKIPFQKSSSTVDKSEVDTLSDLDNQTQITNQTLSETDIPGADLNSSSTESKDVSSLLTTSTSIMHLCTKFSPSILPTFYNPESLSKITASTLDSLTDLKAAIKSIPQTELQSSLIKKSKQTANSLSLNVTTLSIDPSNVSSPIVNNHAENACTVEISSCNRCSSCKQFLYDEEIMDRWLPDDSDLHIICIHCQEQIIPQLTINIRDDSANLKLSLTPIRVLYLNPLVLRKELENLVETSDFKIGDLWNIGFKEKHPVLFWNLIWFFRRIQVTSHLFQILLRSLLSSSDSETKGNLKMNKCILGEELIYEKTSIRIRCMWDSGISYDDIAEPMYKTWQHDGGRDMKQGVFHTSLADALIADEHSSVTEKILRSIASRIQQDDLDAAIGLFIKELAKSIRRRSRRRSIYREFLFLAIVVFGRRNMSYDVFDHDYNNAFQNFNGKQRELVHDFDKCPSTTAATCRRLFSSLEL